MINTSSQWLIRVLNIQYEFTMITTTSILIRVHNGQYEFTMINTSSQGLIRVLND